MIKIPLFHSFIHSFVRSFVRSFGSRSNSSTISIHPDTPPHPFVCRPERRMKKTKHTPSLPLSIIPYNTIRYIINHQPSTPVPSRSVRSYPRGAWGVSTSHHCRIRILDLFLVFVVWSCWTNARTNDDDCWNGLWVWVWIGDWGWGWGWVR